MVVTTKDMRGIKVKTDGRRRRKKIGKITVGVFHPTKKRLIGYLVKRPDAAGMVKREDRFLALDRIRVVKGEKGDEVEPSDEPGTWDERACKRLGVDYDQCVVWEGMPLRTTDDKMLGYVDYVGYDPSNGKVAWVACSESAGSRALLGITKVSAKDIKGYVDGAIQLKKSEREFVPEGGLAAKAGAASVKTKQKAGEVGKKASKAAHKVGHAAQEAADESLDSWHEMFRETRRAYQAARSEDAEHDADDGARDAYDEDDDRDADDDESRQPKKHAPATSQQRKRRQVEPNAEEKPRHGGDDARRERASAAADETEECEIVVYEPGDEEYDEFEEEYVEEEYVVEDEDDDYEDDGDDDATDEDEDRGAELARKFGRQLHRAGGMFSAFKEEYDREVNKR